MKRKSVPLFTSLSLKDTSPVVKMKRQNMEKFLLLYLLLMGALSIVLFICGFITLEIHRNEFSTMNDVPKYVEKFRVKTKELYQPMVKRLVIMVIDALRWDFVADPKMKNAMPVLHSLIEKNSACLLQTRVNPPTVTMPRIKALTSGTIPAFIDVLFNFGSSTFNGDNVLLQSAMQGKKLVFYGDDTWIKLFPGLFERSEGTTSFFVTDFTEVDDNVTRHINAELENDDWSIMILHYLGLDHIGHVSGPYSPLIKPKLQEMDAVIDRIQSRIFEWNRNNIPSLFMVCGDHGMKDSGGHGGSSDQETLIPLISIGSSCSSKPENPKTIAQIDVAATLSVLLGVPIPSSNLGSVILDFLSDLPITKKLFVLQYNAKQVYQHFKSLDDYKNHRAYEHYTKAIKLHVAWLNSHGQQNETVEDIVSFYISALQEMKESLTNKFVNCNIHIIISAVVFIFHALHISWSKRSPGKTSQKEVLATCFAYIILCFTLKRLFESDGETIVLSKDSIAFLLGAAVFLTAVYYFFFVHLGITFQFSSINEWKACNLTSLVLSFGAVLHLASFAGSSFIEEEHQTWYFLWTTFLTTLIFKNAKKISESESFQGGRKYYSWTLVQIILALVVHRILRKLNSTGSKYAHLPDISGWLQELNSPLVMTLILFTGLTLLVLIGYSYETKSQKRFSLFLNIAIASCIYFRHMSTNVVLKIPLYPESRGITEVKVFWILLLIDAARKMFLWLHVLKSKERNHVSRFLLYVLQIWISVSAMLHRPYNFILLPLQLMNFSMIYKVNETWSTSELVKLHVLIGNVYYFYQGNSNSLATIDVAAGYVGLETYNPVTAVMFLSVNTYSATILSYLALLYKTTSRLESSHSMVAAVNSQYFVWRLLPMTVIAIIVGVQRYHLFIWTVFFPKLLYEATHCIVTFSVMLVMQCALQF